MSMTKDIYDLLLTSDITANIWAGYANQSEEARSGLINFFPVPSIGSVDFASGVSMVTYQFDIWHSDMYSCELLRDELHSFLYGRAENINGTPYIFIQNSEDTQYEEDSEIWHYILTFNIKTVKV